MFPFWAFLINELIHRFIFRFVQDKYFGYLKEDFSKSYRATLGYIKLFRLVLWNIKSCKSRYCSSVSETSGVTNLGNKLWTIRLSNTKHEPVSYSGNEEAILFISLRWSYHFSEWFEHRNSAFAFGNIDIYCVHFPYSICLVIRTHRYGGSTCKNEHCNESMADSLNYWHFVPRRKTSF